MRNIKFNIAVNLALLTIMIMAALMGSLLIIGAIPALAEQPHDTYAIYLSPGPTTGVPYGGYHVTITGFQNSQFTTAMRNDVIAAWNKVNGGQPYSLKNKAGTIKYINKASGYGFFFKSQVLNNLADELMSYKVFKGIKNDKWHISLITNDFVAADDLLANLENLPWRLWEVRKHVDSSGNITYHWTLIT